MFLKTKNQKSLEVPPLKSSFGNTKVRVKIPFYFRKKDVFKKLYQNIHFYYHLTILLNKRGVYNTNWRNDRNVRKISSKKQNKKFEVPIQNRFSSLQEDVQGNYQ